MVATPDRDDVPPATFELTADMVATPVSEEVACDVD
jgi:hypothetical protein